MYSKMNLTALFALVNAALAHAAEPGTRHILFEGQPFVLTPLTDRIAVKFEASARPAERDQALARQPLLAGATRLMSLAAQVDVYKFPAPREAGGLSDDARAIATDEAIAMASPIYASLDAELIPTGEVFVQLRLPAPAGAIETIRQAHQLELVERTWWRQGNYRLRVPSRGGAVADPEEIPGPAGGDDVFAVAAALAQRADVEFSQPNLIRLMRPLTVPNDPLFAPSNMAPGQWNLDNVMPAAPVNSPSGANDNDFDIDCDLDGPEAWHVQRGSAGVTIAIIDDGVECTHPDLAGRCVGGIDIPSSSGFPPFGPLDRHGTACAGIAAANTNNGVGVAGIDWNARIMPVRVFTNVPNPYTQDDWLALGIASAYLGGADVLSNSWAGGPPSAQIYAAIRDAVTLGRGGLGAVVVFAAGNCNQPAPSYPSLHPETISVAATSPCDERKRSSHDPAIAQLCDPSVSPDPAGVSCDDDGTWGSNYGDGIDVGAPGVYITTTDRSGADGYDPSDYTCQSGVAPCLSSCFGGTSAAAPQVAGLASLLMAKFPHYTGDEIRARIEQTCDKVGGYAYDPDTGISFDLGHGRINMYRALSGKPQVALSAVGDFPSVYRDVSDTPFPYGPSTHNSAAFEWLGQEYSPEAHWDDPNDPDGKPNVGHRDAFDDGVQFTLPYFPGQPGTVSVTVSVEDSQSSRYVGKNLYVNVWFDWQADGAFDEGFFTPAEDWVVQNAIVQPSGWGVGVNSQTITYSFAVPSDVIGWHIQSEQSGKFLQARVRLSYDQELTSIVQLSKFGEVEDYALLNFVEMFDQDQGFMAIPPTSNICAPWHWMSDAHPTPGPAVPVSFTICHPPFSPADAPPNGYMQADISNDTYLNVQFDSALRTPSFDLRELSEAYLEFDHSGVEFATGRVRVYKNGILDGEPPPSPFYLSTTGPGPCAIIYHQVMDLTPWCGAGNDDIVVEFYTWTSAPCPVFPQPIDYQDWKVDNVVVWGRDAIAPGTELPAPTPLSSRSAEITWATPGDDGYVDEAELFNLRYGPEPIDASNWRHALWVRKDQVGVLPVPGVVGDVHIVTVRRLSPGLHHFALRTLDEINNISGIGSGGMNNPPIQTAPAALMAVAGTILTFDVIADDPDLDPLDMLASQLPAGATYVDNDNNTGTFTWIPPATPGTYLASFTARDPNGLTDQDMTTITIPMPQALVDLVAANPPLDNPYLPGQPYRDVLDTGTGPTLTAGIGGAGTQDQGGTSYSPISVTFSDVPSPLPDVGNVSIACTGGACPAVSGVAGSGAGPYLISLSAPIPPGECTTATFAGTSPGSKLQYQSQPGNVSMNAWTNTQDVLHLITAINNGSANTTANLARYNINRSTGASPVNTQDLLRLIQLLNGTNTTQPFNGAGVADCP